MNITRRIKQGVLSGLALALLLSPLATIQAGAQASNANAAGGLQISPAIVEVNADKGGSYTIQLQVTNVTGSDLTFDSEVNDFTAKDETGNAKIDLDKETPVTASIRQWVTVTSSFSLRARETKKIPATVDIPKNAEPGGHYGVIRFTGQKQELDQTGVGQVVSAGTLVLIRVDGAVDEKLNLITFETAQNKTSSGFFEYGPVTFVTRFENKGNVHVKPLGSIEIRDMFGNKVDTLDVNPNEGNVLPSSVRRFESTLDRTWMFGRYSATVSVGYGTHGQAIVESIDFWVIPYKVVIGGLIALITLIFIFRTLIRRYNSYIIKRAGSSHGTHTKKRKK